MENSGFDIFGKSSADINSHKPAERRESVIYAPKAKDAADGIYEAKIRFLYNPTDPENGSIIRKIVYYLKDAEDKGHYFDSPQSIGNWDACPIGKLWKQLSNSESALDRKNAEELKRRTVFYSLIYIMDDKVNPSNNGKIKILKYGKKLKAKLDRYLDATPKVDIFNFYTGYDFDLTITRQGNFNDYDRAGFAVQSSPISIEGFDPNGDNRELLQKFMADAPDLEEYRYKPWDDAQRAKLESILNQYRSPGEAVSIIVSDNGSAETPKANVVKEAQIETVDLPTGGEATEEISSSTETASAEGGDGDLDNFLDELGI